MTTMATNPGAPRKHKLDDPPELQETPSKPPSKVRDIKDTLMKDPENNPIQASNKDLGGFVAALWPLLEAKFDTWIDNTMQRTVSKKVEQAVDTCFFCRISGEFC